MEQQTTQISSGEEASDVDQLFAGISSEGESGSEEEESTQEDDESAEQRDEQIAKAVSEALGPKRQKRKRAAMQVQDEAAPESEFNLPPSKPLSFCHFDQSSAPQAKCHDNAFCFSLSK